MDHVLGVNNYFLATNDHRSDSNDPELRRSSGVMMVFQKDVPGFANLRHLTDLDIRDKYMVVHTQWAHMDVYFHNVYAPVTNDTREAFFESLPREFPPTSIHVVMGDFNVPHDRDLDSLHLGVIDAWRLHHPTDKVFSSPKGKHRLDYIFADASLVEEAYHTSSYFDCPDPTDHLCHSLTLIPSGPILDTLAHLQTHNLCYEKHSMLMFVPGTVPTLAFGSPYRM
ncbi:hypothetical protein H310_14545 [Aphanomyces invadans]|uniref:Endonuclease/exonuclease/phosphatase domain-containing protein n=1 Tax=Aphanomyces invadans TaxID=157072 RepID=A0A024T976_9STRA|nr:hypothetical protein H310_14545 [Aphanomyces invadans]ETV90705.1 hypothetical protein H310_14545 [Aphanomyces invadans]|eukprot:XP_008880645.1 hypothetical protein H310_14545 [Aphanomyces invadans]